jgi:hypothetical protein
MFKIENVDSLNRINEQIPTIHDKVMVVRFKMEGCVHCVNSQPVWNNMIHHIHRNYRLAPHTMIGEVDSNVADSFVQRHSIQTENNQLYSIEGYPEHVIVVNGVGVSGNTPDVPMANLLINHLAKNKHIYKLNPTKKRIHK